MVGKAEPLIPEKLVSTRSTPSVDHRGELPSALLGRNRGSESTRPVARRGCPGHGEVGAAPVDRTPATCRDRDGSPLGVGNPLHTAASPHWDPHLHQGSWTQAWLPLGIAPSPPPRGGSRGQRCSPLSPHLLAPTATTKVSTSTTKRAAHRQPAPGPGASGVEGGSRWDL